MKEIWDEFVAWLRDVADQLLFIASVTLDTMRLPEVATA